MPATPDKPSAHIELVPASPDQESILANLLELYAHDFSEFYPLDLGADGRFGYKSLHLYWSESGRHPFLVNVDGKLAGLALVKKNTGILLNEDVWDIAEFFILRAYRRRGTGTVAACKVWENFPGPWQVRVMRGNQCALDFWRRAIATFNGEPIQPASVLESDEPWYIFRFQSPRAAKK